AAVKRHGLDRASKKDISYCTTWLRESSWRQVDKRLPDGQRIRVWRTPNWEQDHDPDAPKVSKTGSASTKEASQDPPANSGMTGAELSLAGTESALVGTIQSKADPKKTPSRPRNRSIRIPKQSLSIENVRQTQNKVPWEILKSSFFTDYGIANFYSE